MNQSIGENMNCKESFNPIMMVGYIVSFITSFLMAYKNAGFAEAFVQSAAVIAFVMVVMTFFVIPRLRVFQR